MKILKELFLIDELSNNSNSPKPQHIFFSLISLFFGIIMIIGLWLWGEYPFQILIRAFVPAVLIQAFVVKLFYLLFAVVYLLISITPIVLGVLILTRRRYLKMSKNIFWAIRVTWMITASLYVVCIFAFIALTYMSTLIEYLSVIFSEGKDVFSNLK